jgi:hypothetical protein
VGQFSTLRPLRGLSVLCVKKISRKAPREGRERKEESFKIKKSFSELTEGFYMNVDFD